MKRQTNLIFIWFGEIFFPCSSSHQTWKETWQAMGKLKVSLQNWYLPPPSPLRAKEELFCSTWSTEKKKSPRNWNVKYCLWSNYFEHFFKIFESNNSRAACALGCMLLQQMLGGVMCMVQWIEYRIKSLNLWSGIGLHYVSWIFHTSETGVFWSTLGHLLLVQDLKVGALMLTYWMLASMFLPALLPHAVFFLFLF